MTWHEGGLFSFSLLWWKITQSQCGDSDGIDCKYGRGINCESGCDVSFKYGTAYFYGNSILTVNQGTTTTTKTSRRGKADRLYRCLCFSSTPPLTFKRVQLYISVGGDRGHLGPCGFH